MSAHLGLVLHVQEGNGGLSGWFNNPASGASSTWWVSKTGALEQYVDADICAWAQGSGNSTYNSVETEGFHTEPLTAAQESTLAALYAWGATTYGWPLVLAETPGARGFGWHGMGGSAWGGHTGCPGDLRKSRRGPILAQIGTPTPPPEPPPVEEDDMPGPVAINNGNNQESFYVAANGRLMHSYQTPGQPWVTESLSSGWDPKAQLLAVRGPGDVMQVWGMTSAGKSQQCYWSGRQWVTQPIS